MAAELLALVPRIQEVRIIFGEPSNQNFSLRVKRGYQINQVSFEPIIIETKDVPWIGSYYNYKLKFLQNSNFNGSEKYLGVWSSPYRSCSTEKWLISYTVNIYRNSVSRKRIRAIFSVDVDISNFDINQCDSYDEENDDNVITSFQGTHKCHNISGECIFLPHSGWMKGSYQCVCRRGYYSPTGFLVINGTEIEAAYNGKLILTSSVNFESVYAFKKCQPGCDECFNDDPCLASYNWMFRISLLTICIICILLTFLLIGYVYTYRKLKIIKVSSPIFLYITLIGAIIMYSEMAAIFPVLDIYSCIATKWTRNLGFCVTYSALLLKTWRVSLTYRVKSAHKLKLTDKQLLQWFFPILLVILIYLSTWTLSSPPHAIYLKDWSNLKFKQCEYGWWDHSLALGEFFFLLWGIKVCYNVRKAESYFNESKYISYAIYNITLVNLVMVTIHLVIFPNAPPDMKYLFGFLRTQISTTITIILVFGPKFYRVIKGQGDAWDSRNKVTGFTATFSLNGVGMMHEDTTDLYQENEELKEEVQKLAAQMEFMKLVNMEINNRHLKPKHGGIFSQGALNHAQSPNIKPYSKFDGEASSSRVSPAAELASERV